MVGQVRNPCVPRFQCGCAGNGFLISLDLGNGAVKEYLLTPTSLFSLNVCNILIQNVAERFFNAVAISWSTTPFISEEKVTST